MTRLERSKNEVTNTLYFYLNDNPKEAWARTFLTYQEQMNRLITYEEKSNLSDYYSELLKYKTASNLPSREEIKIWL